MAGLKFDESDFPLRLGIPGSGSGDLPSFWLRGRNRSYKTEDRSNPSLASQIRAKVWLIELQASHGPPRTRHPIATPRYIAQLSHKRAPELSVRPSDRSKIGPDVFSCQFRDGANWVACTWGVQESHSGCMPMHPPTNVGPTFDVPELRQVRLMLVESGRNWAKFGQIRPKFGRSRSKSSRGRSNPSQMRSKSANSVEFEIWGEFGKLG